ncbi:MAG: hypothetical protein K0Q59_2133, partial [Paenibacillus sp.]|nr:hypothetical protein [Paenibacillus sp.]
EKLTVFLCEVEEDRHFATLKAFRSYSYDSGYTWTPREPFGSFHERCNVRQKTVRSDGAWLYPFCYTTPVEEGFTPDLPEAIRMRPDHDVWKRFYLGNRYRCGVLISHDKGETFERYEVPCDREQHFLWEPSLVELSDGRLVMLIRHQYDGWLWRSESLDGGKTWSKAERTDIPDPAVKMRLFKLADGRIVLFCHPNSAVRYPLEMWVSSDDMATWHKKVNLQHLSPVREGTTVSQYHYPDGYVDEVGRKIAIAVDLNRRELVMIEIPFEALD